MTTKSDWEAWAATDPCYAVLTDDQFRAEALDGDALRRFFDRGREDLEMIERAALSLDPAFASRSFLDFGCGVGRMLVWMAPRCEVATGVDAAPSMLERAREHCRDRGLENVRLMTPDAFSQTVHTFDWVNSWLVLQHIPPRQGLAIIRLLAERTARGGMLSLHVAYSRPGGLVLRSLRFLRGAVPLIHRLANRLRRHHDPYMQMNAYPLSEVLTVLQGSGFSEMRAGFTDHGGILGIWIVAMRNPASGMSKDVLDGV